MARSGGPEKRAEGTARNALSHILIEGAIFLNFAFSKEAAYLLFPKRDQQGGLEDLA